MERDHDDADVARRRGGIHWRFAFGAVIIGCLAAGCPRVEDDDSATGDDDTTAGDDDTSAGDDDTSAGDDDTTISPSAPCAFAELSAGRILVSERYAYDAYGDWAWEGAIDAWIWPRPWSRNHGMGVFHWVEAEEGDCRLLGLDPGGCGEPCGPGELCAASGSCEPVWLDGADAGILTVTTAAGTFDLPPDGSGYFTGHYSETDLPVDLFAAGDEVAAALSGDVFPTLSGLAARGVSPIDTDLAGTWLPLLDDQDTLVTWTPGPDPAACVEVAVKGHNAGHGLPLDAILHCVTQDSGSLAIPPSLVQGFPQGEWLGGFDGTACEGMDCLPSELSRFTRHVVHAEPGPVELVVRSTTYFGWSH